MSEQDAIAVVGAGVVGAAVAYALARAGHRIVLLDRSDPGIAGASFGNAGHIATELVQPLPSPGLLFGFWRQQFCFGGVLDLSLRQAVRMVPWMRGFAAAAFRRERNTQHLSPLVLPAAAAWEGWLTEIGRTDLLRRHGHYEFDLGPKASSSNRALAQAMLQLGIKTSAVDPAAMQPLLSAARAASGAGLWFENSAHVLDPLEIVRALAGAAAARGASIRRFEVRAMRPRGGSLEIVGAAESFTVRAAVICAGMDSTALLAPFGVRAPLQAVRGYHVELPGHAPFFDAPVVYTREHVIITPMAGRLRASTYMEFADVDTPSDPRKPALLRRKLRALGYACDASGPSWMGSRPVLPDYLPGIGRAENQPNLFYAVGHQHVGLTIAPATAELVADLVAERAPRLSLVPFDLRRFGSV